MVSGYYSSMATIDKGLTLETNDYDAIIRNNEVDSHMKLQQLRPDTNYNQLNITKTGVGIGVDSFEPNCDLDISGSGALRIPSGETSQRPSVNEIGQVRFNTTTSQFEGYNNSDAWQGLGGVIDVDQDTYISAESAPTADEDQLTFYTSGSQKMKI